MMHGPVKAGFDAGSLGVLYTWWIGIAPAIATTLTIAWVCYCFVEAGIKIYNWWKK